MAEGVLHFFEGWIIFVASALILTIELYFLARLSGRSLVEALDIPKKSVPAEFHIRTGSNTSRTSLRLFGLDPHHAYGGFIDR